MPVVEITIDSTGAVTGMKKYEDAVKRTERSTTASFDKMRASVNTLGKRAFIGLSAAAAATIPLIKRSLEAASTMNETQGIFDKAFDGMMDKADEWSKDLRDNYHLSERASKEYLANLTLVTTGMGITQAKAGEMSSALVKTGAELAAAFDKKTVDVVRDIRSALSGSMETMDKYGVVIRQAQVTQKALSMGLAETTKEITQADKATATYQLILERTKTTTGTVKDEFNGWAGQVAEATKNVEDITVAIGQRLMPMFLPLLQQFNQWAGRTEAITQVTTILVTTLDFLADGMRGIDIAARAVIGIVTQMAVQFAKLLTPLELVLSGMQKLGTIDSNPISNFKDVLDDLANSAIEGFNVKLDKALENTGGFAKALKKANEEAKKAAALQKHNAAVLGIVGDNAKKAANELSKMGDAGVEAGTKPQPPEEQLKQKIDQVTQSANTATSALNNQASAASNLAAAVSKIPSGGGKNGTYESSGAWSGGKGKGSSGTGYFKSNEERQQYIRLTPAGRGNDYYKRYGKYGKRGAGPNAYLDVIDNQKRNALQIMGKTGNTTNNVFNFNQQVSRSDVENITAEIYRNEARA